jgi:hypothetical protein
MIAADELERYQRDMAEYKALYSEAGVNAQKRTRETQSKKNITAQNSQLFRTNDTPECTNNVMISQFRGTMAGLAVDVARRVRGIYFTRPFEIRISFSPHKAISPHPLSHL